LQNGGVPNGNNVDYKNKGKAIDFDSMSYGDYGEEDEYAVVSV